MGGLVKHKKDSLDYTGITSNFYWSNMNLNIREHIKEINIVRKIVIDYIC